MRPESIKEIKQESNYIEVMLNALAREIARATDEEHLERLKNAQMQFHIAKLELCWLLN